MVHIDANRASAIGYPENSSFLEPVARMMDDERKAQYNEEGAHFESAYAIFFTYLPPLEIETRATSLMFESSDKEPKGAQASLQAQIIERFQATLDEIQSQFSTVFESLARMGEQ
jgi:hypothetical protein